MSMWSLTLFREVLCPDHKQIFADDYYLKRTGHFSVLIIFFTSIWIENIGNGWQIGHINGFPFKKDRILFFFSTRIRTTRADRFSNTGWMENLNLEWNLLISIITECDQVIINFWTLCSSCSPLPFILADNNRPSDIKKNSLVRQLGY